MNTIQFIRRIPDLKCSIRNYSLLSNRITQWSTAQPSQTTGRRLLFTEEVLGIDRFIDYRKKIQSQFGSHKTNFVERLNEHVNDDSNVILSEDIKTLIFLCSDDSDIELLKKTIDKFEKQNESLRFGVFQFGPVVMRLMHHLKKPEFALELMNKDRIGFYNQISSVIVGLDLLLENNKYDDVVKVFNFVTENYEFNNKYPTDLVTLYMAACYRLNNENSFQEAFRLVRQVKLLSESIKNRALLFFFGLAINSNHPNIVLEIIQQLNYRSFPIELQGMRLLALAHINRHQDVFDIIRFRLKKDKAQNTAKFVHEDVLKQIEAKLEKENKSDNLAEFNKLVQSLNESGLVETGCTLDEALFKPIQRNRPPITNRDADSRNAARVERTQNTVV